MTKLAILGGQPVVKKPFLPFNTIGKDEKKAVQDVLDTGILSGFVGALRVWKNNRIEDDCRIGNHRTR